VILQGKVMKISWLGHAAFLIETSKGTTIVTDPYEAGSYGGAVGYSPIDIDADIVTVSHQHADHNHTKGFKGAQIISAQDRVNIKGVAIEGVASYHDNQQGSSRGRNIIFVIKADELTIVHCGDLGTTDITADKLKNPDIVFIPVGGTFTLDAAGATEVIQQIKPAITIPMHFKTPKLGFPIDGVDAFLHGKDWQELDLLELSRESLSSFKPIVVLKPQR